MPIWIHTCYLASNVDHIDIYESIVLNFLRLDIQQMVSKPIKAKAHTNNLSSK